MNKVSFPFAAISAVYCVALLLDTLLEVKTINIYGLELTFGTAIIAFVYVCSDCLVEVYGFKRARRVLWFGFFVLLFSTLILKLAAVIPSNTGWEGNEHFDYVYNFSPRIAIACLFAYLTGSYVNNVIMSWLKVKWEWKYFKTRAIISTIFGETVDALVGTFGIFYRLMPLENVLLIAFSMALVKTCIEAAVLPFTSKAVKYLKEKDPGLGSDVGVKYALY